MTYLEYYPDLATLDYVRSIRELDTDETGSDSLLAQYIHAVSSKIQTELQRVCMPYVATKTYDYGGDEMWTLRKLVVDADLLSVTTLTNAGTTVASSSYVLRPNNTYPKNEIRLKASASAWSYATDVEDAVSVVGEWGYVPHYANNAWTVSGGTVAGGGIDDVTTSLTVSDGTLFETLQYLKIGTEVLQITAIATNTLTVARGELGTTAAAHSSGAAISTYHQLNDLQNATAQTVSYLYKTQHQIGGRVTVYQGGTVEVQDLDPIVMQIIKRHKKYRTLAV